MKVYIAGAVTGRDADEVLYDFTAAEQRLRNAGYCVVNPLTVVGSGIAGDNTSNGDVPWEYAMKKCIGELVKCDAMLLLPGWENSHGVKLEVVIAGELGIEIIEGI